MVKKIIILGVIAGIVACYFIFDVGQYLNLESLKANKERLFSLYENNQVLFLIGFFLVYVVSTAVSIPGATILTLTGGFLFGRYLGTGVVAVAACIGATLAMVIARTILGDSLQKKYQKQLATMNQGIERDGGLYLLSLRLIPVFPFFLINLLMGLTTMSVGKFYLYSQIGMLPGTFIYVNAGTALSNIENLSDILSVEIFASFALLGIVPLVIKWIMKKLKKTNTTSDPVENEKK
jgi:uncharacterized membrane protein YdjX (TVP38/TMEM64 family)